jgi:NACalpha-BTF3-like transcription factor
LKHQIHLNTSQTSNTSCSIFCTLHFLIFLKAGNQEKKWRPDEARRKARREETENDVNVPENDITLSENDVSFSENDVSFSEKDVIRSESPKGS